MLTAGGGMCSACCALVTRTVCFVCGKLRRVNYRNEAGQPVCPLCTQAGRRRNRLDQLVDEITTVVQGADSSVTDAVVRAAVDQVAPKVPDRMLLRDLLEQASNLKRPAARRLLVARVLAGLRDRGSILPAATCEDCAGPAEPLVTYGQMVRCRSCARRCPGCGAARKAPEGRLCRACAGGRKRADCTGCQRTERVLDASGRCRFCRERAARRCSRCDSTGGRTWFEEAWICHRCALTSEVGALFGLTESVSPALASLRQAVIGAGNPDASRRWLANSSGGRLFRTLIASGVPLTHQVLDDAGADRSIEHLRHLLVAAGALPDHERVVDRFEVFATRILEESLLDPRDRKVTRSWLRWAVVARLRQRTATGNPIAASAANARVSLRAVTTLLETWHRQGRNLGTATQADLDAWFCGPGALRWRARPFLVWARQRGHLPRHVSIPSVPKQGAATVGNHVQRWELARRLVTDDTIPDDIRVAGALIVLYGQPLVRIVGLTDSALHRGGDGTIVVELEGHPVPVHEPFATLMERLPCPRTDGISDQFPGPWLFPGRQAHRHVGAPALARRLRELGIEPRHMRNTARAQLAAQIPAGLLAEIIGISANTATQWASRSSGNWTSYAADRVASDHG
jgi:hypothetical protein